MEPAKLQFSSQEMHLVTNAEWILTKNEILNKVSLVMGQLNSVQKSIIDRLPKDFPFEIINTTPKISRGENYKGLPYLVLDYPRLFTKDNIFAIRSLFWWGKTLSTTLHLSGRWQQFFREKISDHYEIIKQNNFVVSVSDDEWVHDASGDDYKSIESISKESFNSLTVSRSFLKLAIFSPVTEINNGAEIWKAQFEQIIKLLADQ